MKRECHIIAMIIMLVVSAVTIMAGTTDQVVNPSGDLSITLSGIGTQPLAEGMVYEIMGHHYDGLMAQELELTLNQTQISSRYYDEWTFSAMEYHDLDQVIPYREAADQQEIPPVSKAEFDSYMILGGYRTNPEPAKPETVPRL